MNDPVHQRYVRVNRSLSPNLHAPAVLWPAGFLVAMAAVLQFSCAPYFPAPGSGRLYAANFTDLLKPLYARVFLDTVWICFLTAIATLIVAPWPMRWCTA